MKNVVLICLFGLCANLSYGQYSLSFCEDVNNSGKPVSPSNSFLVNKTGSALKVLLKSDSQLNTSNMDFKIYYINDNGKEEEVTRLSAPVQSNWDYVWKELVFFDPGNYRVKVYNSDGNYLTSANLNVRQ
jgi:hypothetical protein